MKKLYLAGFDVFAPDAVERGAAMQALCAQYGFEGLYPLDNEADGAAAIYAADLSQLRQADAVVANLNPFRGLEPDSGTCFELGYAAALGKELYAYRADGRTQREVQGEADADGFTVEDFGMPVNLMLGCSVHLVVGNLEDCLRKISKNKKT